MKIGRIHIFNHFPDFWEDFYQKRIGWQAPLIPAISNFPGTYHFSWMGILIVWEKS